MSSIYEGLACFAIAAVLSSPVSAQGIPSPVSAQGIVLQKNITLALAQTIANAAIAQCRSMGYKISVTVVDREGLPIVMMRDDGAGLHTPEGSDRKAYTARAFGQASADFVKLPIKVGDEIVGAVGVSGTPGKDDDCSQAGIDKVADQLK